MKKYHMDVVVDVFNMKTPKIEGYWALGCWDAGITASSPKGWKIYSNNPPEYKMPIPNVLSHKQAEVIYQRLKFIQSIYVPTYYMGYSQSRLTGERLGDSEYDSGRWRWPGDFGSHYVREHRVKPSDEFLSHIGVVLEGLDAVII